MKNTILSSKYTDLMNAASGEIPTWINTDSPDVPELFRKFAYPISSWPVILDKEKVDMLNKLSTRILKLITQIPSLYFNDDEEKIADYYFNGNAMLAQFAMLSHNKNNESCCRIDLAYTDDGFKILEANIGSSIGGWQLQSFTKIITEIHPLLKENYKSINTQLIYYEFLVNKILKHVDNINSDVNIYISMDNIDNGAQTQYLLDFLNDLLSQTLQKKNLKGKVFLGSLTKLNFKNNLLYLDATRIHAVLNMSTEEITPHIMRAFIMDAIYFPDHLGGIMYRDKTNLGLLRELAELQKFSPEDNDMILKTIPWTTGIKEKEVMFQGKNSNLTALLRAQKDEFVIKAAYGEQGKDVFIGKFSSKESWEKAIQRALTEEKYIAQEFSDSQNFMAPNPDNVWTEHKLIWGSFGFGETYGGVFVRMSAIKTDVGIINAAKGAVEAIVFESI